MSITSRITSMEEHVTNAYNGLQGLGADLTGIDKNIDNIASVLDDIYDDLPKVTGSGTSITLDDTRKGRLESTLSGNTSQFTTTGKNLFNIEGRYETGTGIEYTKNDDGSYTLNGTANGNNFLRGVYHLNEQHTLSYTSNVSNSNVILRTRTGTPSAQTGIQDQLAVSSTSGNLTSSEQFDFVEISIVSGTTLNNFKIYIQLEKGSSVTSFEPYTGGQASPNPDYPQDIHVVSGDNEINVCGKNLFRIGKTSSTQNGVTYSYNEDGTLNLSGTATGTTYFSVTEAIDNTCIVNGESYKFSINKTIPSGIRFKIELYNGTSYVREYYVENSSSPATISINLSNITSIRYVTQVNNGVTTNISNVGVQLEKGNSATSFMPFSRDTYPINLPVENLYNGEVLATNQRLSTSTGGGYSVTGWSISSYVSVKPNTTYTISTGERIFCDEYSETITSSFIKGTAQAFGVTTPITITTSSTTNYIRFDFPSGNESVSMVELGSKANSYTPYGTTPIELCKIGTYQDKIAKSTGKNLFDYNDLASKVQTFTTSGTANNFTVVGYGTYQYPISISTNAIISGSWSTTNLNGDVKAIYTDDTNENIFSSYTSSSTSGTINFTPAKTIKAIQFRTFNSNNNITFNNFMINEGTTALPYEPYGTSWYLHKEIGKVVLDGSENITTTTYSAGAYFHNIINIGMNGTNNDYAMSNYYTYSSSYMNNTCKTANGGKELVTRDNFDQSTYITWLGTNNPKFYYLLAAPTNTKITYEPLLEQLETIYNAQGYDNQTNISQTNSDLPFKITASALKEWSV